MMKGFKFVKVITLSLCALTQPLIAATLSWEHVDGATHYRLEKKLEGESWKPLVDNQRENSFDLSTIAPGKYYFQVKGCVEELSNPIKIHCDGVGLWAESGLVDLEKLQQRRVIFIHTDLLGTPAAESGPQAQ